MFEGKQWKNQQIYIQDLFCRKKNVGAFITEKDMNKFKKAMQNSVSQSNQNLTFQSTIHLNVK